MSRIAQRITGLTSLQLFEINFKSIHSIEEICDNEKCRDPRIYAGLLTSSVDLNKEREKLKKTMSLKVFKVKRRD